MTVAAGSVVDDEGRASADGVWAAGDVARSGPRRVEHWHAARESGDRAARSMLGLPPEPRRAPWTFTEVGGHQLDAVGATEGSLETRRLSAPRGEGFALAFVGVPVEAARGLIERRAPLDELAALVG